MSEVRTHQLRMDTFSEPDSNRAIKDNAWGINKFLMVLTSEVVWKTPKIDYAII